MLPANAGPPARAVMTRAFALTAILLLFPHVRASAQALSLDSCQALARANYPLVRQYGLIEKTREFTLDNAGSAYLPQLKNTAYDGVTVRQLLTMSSGVGWNETYTDPASDRRRMLEAQIAQQPGAILQLMAGLPRVADPGTRWNYSTGETQVAVASNFRATAEAPAP